jgi:hypothetical protein
MVGWSTGPPAVETAREGIQSPILLLGTSLRFELSIEFSEFSR